MIRFETDVREQPLDAEKSHLVLPQSEKRRQYERTREFLGVSIDQIINSGRARQLLRELWLLGCMVRRPEKAASLPPGNPFRNNI
jgi:hypothetical protein